MTDKIRWGILSTGNIAGQFADGLAVLPDAELVAVGSRSQESADQFGAQYDVPHRHASYEALANDPDVDVVYIGTPHPYHAENALLCLHAGKHVLCEKPFTINAAELEAVVRVARERGLFLMEALWTRFIPAMTYAKQLIDEGIIGDVKMVYADFGFSADVSPEHRLLNPALGGGALLDVGIYPVSFASSIIGQPPVQVASAAQLGETGVDVQGAYLLTYPDGQIAVLSAAVQTETAREAVIVGSQGRIKIHKEWWVPETITLYRNGSGPKVVKQAQTLLPDALYARVKALVKSRIGRERVKKLLGRQAGQTMHFPMTGNGYNYEAAEVMRCLRAGLTESPVVPLDESLTMMRTLDTIRAQWGLKYPME